MLRRTFFIGSAGAALVPGAVLAEKLSGPARPDAVISSYVADIDYRQADEVRSAIRPHSVLQLRRAPDTSFDSRTIEVWAEGTKIGNLPGQDARVLAPLMDAGIAFEATVSDMKRGGARPEIRLDLRLIA